MPKIYIDNKPYEVKDGDNLLQACLGLGLDLPYFCWHPAMGSVGACRQCAVVQYQNEEDTRGRIVMGCMTPVTEGARFSMNCEGATEFRENIIESLMLNHPHDCPVCAEGGECHLQDMTVMVGHRDRHYRGKKNTYRNQYLGPLINHEMNRCITCYRCVRFYRDYAGGTDLSEQAAHDHIYFGRQRDGVLESEFSGNLVEICPTGVFTDKPLVHEYTRKWDLQSAPSVCTGCGVGCNTMPGERYGKLKRVHNRFNHEVNGYFLCDRGRYGGAYTNSEKRLSFAGLRDTDGLYNAVDKTMALDQLEAWCDSGQRIAAIGSPRASLETNYLLRRLVGSANFSPGFSVEDQQLMAEISKQLRNSRVITPSIKQTECADAVLILGEDVTNTAPILALSLRQAVRNRAFELADQLGLQHWQDAAVRNLAQDQRSPLFIAAVSNTRLDDVAQESISLTPDNITRLGVAVAAQLDHEVAPPAGLTDQLSELAGRIAQALKTARRPLIVSGTGCRQHALIQVASRIADALTGDGREPMLSYCVPECNSLGMALLHTDLENQPTIEALSRRAGEGEIDTLIVVENDLTRRTSKTVINNLFAGVEHVVVIDALDNPTISRADLALPAATVFESEGTLVNSEGRAQRYYPVYSPADDRQASWRWLVQLGLALNTEGFDTLRHFDQVEEACARDNAALAKIAAAAPAATFRNHGLKIPRQPHRYSGRTAMRANISVHEPKSTVDDETPFSFSMEGLTGTLSNTPPGSVIPFVWSPGWNSNQSVHKYQREAGGSLIGGTPGVRLIEPVGKSSAQQNIEMPTVSEPKAGTWLLVPQYRIFGSEELSVHAPAIAELAGQAVVQLHPNDADTLKVDDGDGISIDGTDFEVQINASLVSGCVGFAVGMSGAEGLQAGNRVVLQKAEDWQRRKPNVIASDRGENHV